MIPIKKVKQIREDLGVPCLVIITGVPRDGEVTVATHGKTKSNAADAAHIGNEIKKWLGWPEHLCNSKPLERICGKCDYWQRRKLEPGDKIPENWGGCCMYEPVKELRYEKDKCCGHFEPNC